MVRKAVLNDVPDIYELVESYAKKGVMLHRPSSEIRRTTLIPVFCNGKPLRRLRLAYAPEDMGEIRSLAVKEGATGKGIGTALVNACINEARQLRLKRSSPSPTRLIFSSKGALKR